MERAPLTEAGLAARTAYALNQSLEFIRGRIDQVGIAEPIIQRVGSDRILVQLPGIQDPTRLRQLLDSTEGAGDHCEMRNRSLLTRRTLDWLDEVMGRKSG